MVFVGHEPLLITYHPEAAQAILSSTWSLLNKSKEYDYLQDWLATGLLTSSDRKWQTRRKMLTPAFHFKILEDALAIFNEQVGHETFLVPE